ncbi:MAG TPA: tail fiber domain-containing protein, partial [Alphaproteobacteria bacterium]|nr:tail fiber domain-containing protein [Alphaproteobacteria bacterium]
DNVHSIQSYIDGHWSDRGTYGGPCCNTLNIETDAGYVVIGNGLTGGGVTLNGTVTFTGPVSGGITITSNSSAPINSTTTAGSGQAVYGYSTNSGCWGNLGSTALNVSASGNCGTSYYSDGRLKKDVATVENGLDTIMKLKPISFLWKNNKKNANLITNESKKAKSYGFIAQDVEQVLPDLISQQGEELGKTEGIPVPKGGFLSLNYDGLISPMVKAIQELNTKVEKLMADVKALGITIENGITHIAALAVDTFTVGSAEKPSGITLYDEDTRQPYCVKIKGGKMVNLPGACGVLKTSAAH